MKRNFLISIWMTLATTVLLGIIYPLVVTGLAQLLYPRQASGELIRRPDGTVVGSTLLG
jgi:K+-transporting ATPase ATPase C chain